jgi:hypothetical protein
MTRLPRWLLVLGIVTIAALLAFPLRDTIYKSVVIPLAFISWQLGLWYRSLSQVIWWGLIVVFILYMLVYSLIPYIQPRRKAPPKSRPNRGPVEDLAIGMGRAKGGVYFKWLIANRLGKLAYQVLLHRESGRPRSVFAPLLGADWEPTKELQTYLEIGLHGSFSDYPTPKHRMGPSPRTPLDYDIGDAVAFLESQVENSNIR